MATNTYHFTVTVTLNPQTGETCQGAGFTSAPIDLVVAAPANAAPTVAADNASVTVDEGAQATNTGTWSDADAGDTVTLSTSVGTIIKSGTNAAGTWSWSFDTTDGPDESQTVTITADDGTTVTSTTFALTVNNVAPTVVFTGGPTMVDESGVTEHTFTYSISDPGDDTVQSVSTSCGTGGVKVAMSDSNDNSSGSFKCKFLDGPASPTVTAQATDSDGDAGNMAAHAVTVNNVAPENESITATPPVIPILATSTVRLNFTDDGTLDTHTCSFDWDGAGPDTPNVSANETGGSGYCEATQQFLAAGVYTVKVTLTDDDGGTASPVAEVMVVVYDPSAGFVTGGGWINSPAGAYVGDASLAGKANFGFVSKYKKGATTPTGETEFQFKAGNLNFHSATYQWLVVSGAKAQYKGTGTINGVGGYGFLLTATDGQISGGGGVDKFRIKIWDTSTNTIVYDNVQGGSDDIDAANPQALGGGSIVIHK